MSADKSDELNKQAERKIYKDRKLKIDDLNLETYSLEFLKTLLRIINHRDDRKID